MNPVLANNLAVKAELLRLSRALTASGVEHIVLKGVPLVQRLYARLDGRFIGDNDILIQAAAQERALAVLQQLGYRAKHEPRAELAWDGRATFISTGTPAAFVDLHVNAFEPRLFAVPSHELWSRHTAYDVGEHEVQVLDECATLLHLAAHFVQHACAEERVLVDLSRAWDRWSPDLDRSALHSLARRWGVLDSLIFGLGAARELGLLQLPPPPWSTPRATLLRRTLPSQRLLHYPERGFAVRAALMATLIAPGRLPLFVRSYLFPPAEKMRAAGWSRAGDVRWWQYGRRLLTPLWSSTSPKT